MTFLYDLITSKISIISYQIPHEIKMTTFAFIFKANFIRQRYFAHVVYNVHLLIVRTPRLAALLELSRRIRDQRDSAMVMKMREFVHDHGPR